MDNVLNIRPKFAHAKAFTSTNLGMATADLAPFATERKPYYGFNTLFGGELTDIAGGIPVKIQGKLIGGVGVGGSMDVTQDAQCAQEAAKILEE